MDLPELQIVQIEPWTRYEWLRHGFSTRFGGVSTAYGGHSLNLGWTKEDDASAVKENRRRFVAAVSGDADFTLAGVRQIHSGITHVIRQADGAREGRLTTPEGKAVLEGDGLMTDLPGVLLAAGTADCVPVLVVDVHKKAVAAFHAGWRGTAARIVEQGIERMRQEYGSRPEDLTASIGPSIGPCCYSVGEEVHAQFASNFPYAQELFREVQAPDSPPELHLNLWEANRRQLLAAGLEQAKVTVVADCTACSRDLQGALRYFSHRGERGIAGRMLNVVGIAK